MWETKMQPKLSLRLPSAAIFWSGLLAVGILQIGGAAFVAAQPWRQAERAQQQRLCALAIEWVLGAHDQTTLERGKYLIRELDCDIVRNSMSAAL
ncbi:hypothetical protein LRS10_23130 [Phenylobacterium sp. J426]|uniref:hypothetical protein n=1 Tax=Phenylobacterium sp. J426 TaxID=2898439 RepID=UPI0021513E21|nr:hypothetical protein [Phenylobacterium sp. J426]MCR5876792.1 hypothetical protein [Phenylobacterium sp. J426]